MARRTAQPVSRPPAPKKQNTVLEMRRGVERIRERIEELKGFDVSSMTEPFPHEVAAMQVAIKGTLHRIFGEGTADYERFCGAEIVQWTSGISVGNYPALPDYRKGIRENISHAVAILEQAVKFLEEEIADSTDLATPATTAIAPSRDLSKVFIVHGHDGEARQTVARYIEKLDLEAVILHERPNKGRTIITKFREEAAGVGFAIVLMTPDDVGGVAGADATQLRPRARQNVVFELGFFIGELGAEHVAALVKGDIERPSDFDGVVYISLDDGAWQMELARELKAAGYAID